MALKAVSVKIDEQLLEKIDSYAEKSYQSRSQAIIQMLTSTSINVIAEGAGILKDLHILHNKLNEASLTSYDKKIIKEALDEIWLLLNSATQKLTKTTTPEES